MGRNQTLQGFVVVVASCVIYLLLVGAMRLSGQLFLACRDRFGVSRKEASLPFTLVLTIRNFCGPVVGYLGNKFGLQSVTIFGCFVSAISVGACFFADDIKSFTALWGVGLGLGFGLSTLLLTNMLHLQFKNNFNKMNGIFMASGSLGAVLFPGIAEYFLETFGFDGTFLVVSGLMLHSVPAAMLLKVPDTERESKANEDAKNVDQKDDKSSAHDSACDSKTASKGGVPKCSCHCCNGGNQQLSLAADVQDAKSEYVYNQATILKDQTSCELFNGDLNIREHKEYAKNRDNVSNIYFQKDMEYVSSQANDKARIVSRVQESRHEEVLCGDFQEALLTTKTTVEIADEGLGNTKVNDPHSKRAKLSCFITSDFRLFLDPAYIILLISSSAVTMAGMSMYTVIVDASRDKDILEDVTILMTFSITEMLGRIFFGCLADLRWLSPLYMYAFCCGVSGLVMIGFTFIYDFYTVAVFFAVIGALIGGFVSLPNGIIRDYIEKENLTMAFTSRSLFFGLLNFAQPSIIGYFRETLHSYDGLFYLFGSMCIVCAIIIIPMPLAAKWRDRKKNIHTM